MLLKLAFRNLWRNRRRSLITAAAVAFAVFTASTMRSFQKGVWDKVVNGSVSQYFGHVQLHGKGFSSEQLLDKSFEWTEEVKSAAQHSDVVQTLPRLESFALASSGSLTKGVLVLGVSPEKENKMSDVAEMLEKGEFLDENDQSVLVGSSLSEKLKLELGDTLVLLSQGFRGANAAGKFPLKGIVKFALPDLNQRLVYMPLRAAQDFYGAADRLTTLAFQLCEKEQTDVIVQHLNSALDTALFEVMPWEKTIPELVQARAADEAGGKLIFFLLYMLIGFGLFGTIMMMTKERSYEFGVLTAIGMRRNKLFFTVWLETIFIALLGAVVGIFMSVPVVYYLHTNPLDMTKINERAAETYEKFGIEPLLPTAFDPSVFLWQAVVIFLITSVLAWYPFYKIRTMRVVEAMRE